MSIDAFLLRRKEELGLSLSEIETQFNLRGYSITKSSIAHWTTGMRKPPIKDRKFLEVLADIYKMSVPELLAGMGLMEDYQGRSSEALRAADLIDQMPPEQRKMALSILEAMRGAQNG
jgi:transcriptional regulator with XRE-family HTH domain